jgi:potassium efflux system protein
VQWLAAAITVGLGFGLQEIVANFVSGVILLFEQPIRVGDTVTVGEKTGTVSRIRMRATTIVDWDRKELIIPNKEFVTGQIVNWTLTDTILRVAVPIGVAYGTDTGLVKRLLLETARSCAQVLEDPPPVVVFQQFGDSSLNFELRFFVPNVSSMLDVKTQVMERIHSTFREAGVEIPFPQRAVRVISDTPPIRIEQPRAEQRGAGDGSAAGEWKGPASSPAGP